MKKNLKLVVAVIILILLLGLLSAVIFKSLKPNSPAEQDLASQEVVPTEFPQQVVRITKEGFVPPSVTIKSNSVVVWKNESGKEMAIVSDPHPSHALHPELNLGNVDATSGATQAYFSTPGTYTYHNEFDTAQIGTIIVE